MYKDIELKINVQVFASSADLVESERQLHIAAGKALLGAYAPYSRFSVGAAVLLENGQIVLGNNQENGAYPSGLCAERVALFAARANHPNLRIIALAIQAASDIQSVSGPVSPCGSCRQVMTEYENNQANQYPVIFSGQTGPVYRVASAGLLLPLGFNGSFLKKP